MSDLIIRLIREELRNSALTPISRSRLQDILSIFTKALWKIHTVNENSKLIISKMLDNVEQDIEILARTRLLKLLLRGEIAQGSFDEKISALLVNIVRAEKNLMSPLVVRYHEKVLYFFKNQCMLSGKLYRKGDIVLLDLDDFILAEISNCGEPMKQPFLKYHGPR
ncbi:MAG: hypothetical protein QXP02_00650 [Desulfurococcaceae archaeon]